MQAEIVQALSELLPAKSSRPYTEVEMMVMAAALSLTKSPTSLLQVAEAGRWSRTKVRAFFAHHGIGIMPIGAGGRAGGLIVVLEEKTEKKQQILFSCNEIGEKKNTKKTAKVRAKAAPENLQLSLLPDGVNRSLATLPLEARLAQEFASAVVKMHRIRTGEDHAYSRRKEISQDWISEFRKMLAIDKRGEADIRAMIAFSLDDDFWFPNIQSPHKLRKHWDRLINAARGRMLHAGKKTREEADIFAGVVC